MKRKIYLFYAKQRAHGSETTVLTFRKHIGMKLHLRVEFESSFFLLHENEKKYNLRMEEKKSLKIYSHASAQCYAVKIILLLFSYAQIEEKSLENIAAAVSVFWGRKFNIFK